MLAEGDRFALEFAAQAAEVPGERFEVVVDFTDGKAVTLETGPDEELGAFGAMMEHRIDGDYEPVMRFEPTKTVAPVKALPTRLGALPTADPNKAANRRQFILDSSMCMTSNQLTEMKMALQQDLVA